MPRKYILIRDVCGVGTFSMSKGGQGAAAANILLLKKSEESRKQETVIRDAIRVSLINTKKSLGSLRRGSLQLF